MTNQEIKGVVILITFFATFPHIYLAIYYDDFIFIVIAVFMFFNMFISCYFYNKWYVKMEKENSLSMLAFYLTFFVLSFVVYPLVFDKTWKKPGKEDEFDDFLK